MRLPRNWSKQFRGVVAECDISPTRRGRLKAKLLIFATVNDLKRFWRVDLDKGSLGRFTKGAVNGLCHEVLRVNPDGSTAFHKNVYDPRYFCVIGLVKRWLSMEVISHESVHAGFCYAKRVKKTPWAAAREFDEEEVAYPAGAIAAAINRFLFRKGLYR